MESRNIIETMRDHRSNRLAKEKYKKALKNTKGKNSNNSMGKIGEELLLTHGENPLNPFDPHL